MEPMASEALNLTVADLERRFGVVAKQPAVCPEHGEYAAVITRHRSTPSGCPKCAEIRQAEQDRADSAALAAKAATERLERKMGAALIPKRFRERDFAGYRAVSAGQQRALTVCREYAESFDENLAAGRCLLLLGKPGTGKTHLAVAIAGHVMRQNGATAVYRTVAGLLQYVKGSYDRDSEYSEADAFRSLVEPDLLILDEIGATKPTEFEQATVFAVINARYEEQLPTIVVSNLGPKELPGALGERCVDRLREGGGIALVFDWESARAEVRHG
ncbi:DNA replication protein DnaC [compost metagenome]